MSATQDPDHIKFMKDLEGKFQADSGLNNRAWYKIWYCQARPASILTLGLNPAGNPREIDPDGVRMRDGSSHRNAASATFYENGEHDLIDCNWRENKIVGLLQDVLGGDRELVRREVVKTNICFRRSPKPTQMKALHGMDMKGAIQETLPFLADIVRYVSPKLILLGGVKLEEFAGYFCRHWARLQNPERDDRIKQVIFDAADLEIDNLPPIKAVQVAHASQFSWTYEKFGVAKRIRTLIPAVS